MLKRSNHRHLQETKGARCFPRSGDPVVTSMRIKTLPRPHLAPDAARRLLTLAAAVVLAALLAACSTLGGPRTIVVDNAELSRRMAAQFPIERRWLEAFDLELSNPRVSSRQDSGRMRVDLDLRVGERLFRNAMTARVALDSRVRFDPADHTLRLSDPQLEAFKVDGDSLLGRAGSVPLRLLSQWLDGAVVYRLEPAQIERIERHGLALRAVEVVEQGLRLQFEPRAR